MGTGTHPESGLTKSAWSDADFDEMGWHDATIHGLCVQPGAPDGSLPPRLLLDIDYIVRWVHPVAPQTHFSFWTAPSTLVFDDVWDFEGDLGFKGMGLSLQIDHLRRSAPEDGRGGPRGTSKVTSSTSSSRPRDSTSTYGRRPSTRSGLSSRTASEEGSRSRRSPSPETNCLGDSHRHRRSIATDPAVHHQPSPGLDTAPFGEAVSRRAASARCRPPAARPPRSAALRTAP